MRVRVCVCVYGLYHIKMVSLCSLFVGSLWLPDFVTLYVTATKSLSLSGNTETLQHFSKRNFAQALAPAKDHSFNPPTVHFLDKAPRITCRWLKYFFIRPQFTLVKGQINLLGSLHANIRCKPILSPLLLPHLGNLTIPK